MRLRPFLILPLLATAFAACNRQPAPPPTSTAPAETPGPRIVSTVPAATLNLTLIGATNHLVGVTKYDRLFLPPDKQNLPTLDSFNFNYEQLVKLRPTVLI